MSVIRLADGNLMLHSPGGIDDGIEVAISRLGHVRYIVAPSIFHHMHVALAQSRYPKAQTYICPGVERRDPELRFDWILGPRVPDAWRDTIDQALIRGSKHIWEVAMLHKPSKTLLLVDSIEYFTDRTEGVNLPLKTLWKYVLRMWNKPRPAPEYGLGWRDEPALRASLSDILKWDFDKIILSHGDNIIGNAKGMARRAWTPLMATDSDVA